MTENPNPEPMSHGDLQAKLNEHRKWLDSEGKEGSQADFSYANLKNAAFGILVRLDKAIIKNAHLENAGLAFAYLDNAILDCAYLENATLISAHMDDTSLFGAHLNKAILSGATINNADLRDTNLQQARLIRTKLSNSNLSGAHLENSILQLSTLVDVNMTGAHLENADLTGAHLENVNLQLAHLENADLRATTGLKLDMTHTRNAIFTPVGLRLAWFLTHGFNFSKYPNDPWSVLRQMYSGPRLAFHILVLIAFTLPYIGRAIALSFVSQAERRAIAIANEWKEALVINAGGVNEKFEESVQANAEQRKDAPGGKAFVPQIEGGSMKSHEMIERSKKKANDKLQEGIMKIQNHTQKTHIFWVLIHWDKAPWRAILAITLILYNLAIYYLVISIGPLRDEEERSGVSPCWDDYRKLRYYHWFVCVVFYISLTAFVFNVIELLCEPIWMQK